MSMVLQGKSSMLMLYPITDVNTVTYPTAFVLLTTENLQMLKEFLALIY